MKHSLFLFFLLVLASCTKTTISQRFIEPCEYFIRSYEVKDAAFFDSVLPITYGSPYITISDESSFTATKELGKELFGGDSFTYRICGDSLILSRGDVRKAYYLSRLDPNSFSLMLNHKYFTRIDLFKPEEKSRKIEETVTIKY